MASGIKLSAFWLFAMISLVFTVPAHAAIQCYECHGIKGTMDYRPVDAPYRNISTGGFQGNHQTHMAAPAGPGACAKCHPGSSGYTPAHRDGKIKLSSNINSSPLATTYRNSTSAFFQTANPALGACANVNCHFEAETPAWGNALFGYPSDCGRCHGSPPFGATGGAPGSHGTHDLYYPGAGQCNKCHTDHAIEGSPFAHATSAGRRDLIVLLHDPAGTAGGAYSGPLNDYLPSQANNFGNCSDIYCHSKGTGATPLSPNVTPTWGTPLPADCSGCHGGDSNSAVKIDTGSHTTHAGKAYYARYVYDCSICHSVTAADSRTIAGRAAHVNQEIDVVLNSTYGGTYSTNGHQPGEPAGTCQNIYCHSNVQNPDGGVGGPTFYGTPAWGTAVGCGSCHQQDGAHTGHGGAKISTGSHAKHLSYSFTTTGNAPKCMICHKYTDQPFVPSCFGNPYGNTVCHWGAAKYHANHQVDVIMDPVFGNATSYKGTPAPGDGYSYCANTYCHGNGTSVSTGTIPANITVNWGTAGPLACNSCHGFPPNYPSASPKANSHAAHLKNHHSFKRYTSQVSRQIFQSYSTIACNACHSATSGDGLTVSSTVNHVNEVYNVVPGGVVSFTYAYSPSGGTCTNISCHNGQNAMWGATLSCLDCHTMH